MPVNAEVVWVSCYDLGRPGNGIPTEVTAFWCTQRASSCTDAFVRARCASTCDGCHPPPPKPPHPPPPQPPPMPPPKPGPPPPDPSPPPVAACQQTCIGRTCEHYRVTFGSQGCTEYLMHLAAAQMEGCTCGGCCSGWPLAPPMPPPPPPSPLPPTPSPPPPLPLLPPPPMLPFFFAAADALTAAAHHMVEETTSTTESRHVVGLTLVAIGLGVTCLTLVSSVLVCRRCAVGKGGDRGMPTRTWVQQRPRKTKGFKRVGGQDQEMVMEVVEADLDESPDIAL